MPAITPEQWCNGAIALIDENQARLHYRRHLLNRLMSVFVWEGFDESVPSEYVEMTLLLNGVVGFIERNGVLTPVMCWGAVAPDEFYRCKNFTYAQPVLGSGTIDADSVIYNENLAPWFPWDCKDVLDKYADMLATADISFKVAMKNSRLTHIIVTDNEQDVKNTDKMLDGVSNGALATTVYSPTLIGDGIKVLPASEKGVEYIRQLSEAREYIYNCFLSEFGIHANTVLKREREITDEIDMQIEKPAFNVYGMLKARQEGAERINKKFGTNITVKLNPAITIVEDSVDAMEDGEDDIYDASDNGDGIGETDTRTGTDTSDNGDGIGETDTRTGTDVGNDTDESRSSEDGLTEDTASGLEQPIGDTGADESEPESPDEGDESTELESDSTEDSVEINVTVNVDEAEEVEVTTEEEGEEDDVDNESEDDGIEEVPDESDDSGDVSEDND